MTAKRPIKCALITLHSLPVYTYTLFCMINYRNQQSLTYIV